VGDCVKWERSAGSGDVNSRFQRRVANAKLVKCIWIQICQISNDQLRIDNVAHHAIADHSGISILIGALYNEAKFVALQNILDNGVQK